MVKIWFVLSLDISLIIANLLSIPDPRDSILAILLGVGKRFESIAKERLLFDKIDDIDPNLLILACVGDLEVKPLIVSSCIDVVLKDEVVGVDNVLLIVVLVDIHQVATLEVGVKYQRPIIFA